MVQVKLDKTIDMKLPMAALSMSSIDTARGDLVVGCMDGIYRVNLKDQSFEKLDEHSSYVSSVQLRESVVISAGYDGMLQWFDLNQAKRARQIKVHDFWSWDMALSPNGSLIASVTGQYLAGGYKYEPAPEREPSVKIVSADAGEVLHQWPHVPSVQAVAFSPDSRFVAAGNLMGEVRIWDSHNGELVATWTTPDFTSWGIIKSHCYLGGIFAIEFTSDGNHLLLVGMGPMRDPMAGNGRQLWQKWAWKEDSPRKVDETHQGESGEGLIEALAVSPAGDCFAIGGRLRGGDWNVAVFDCDSGNRIASLKTGYRVTALRYSAHAKQLIVVGTQGQPQDKKGDSYPHFGRVEVYNLS
jgi:WD40 repeat protein